VRAILAVTAAYAAALLVASAVLVSMVAATKPPCRPKPCSSPVPTVVATPAAGKAIGVYVHGSAYDNALMDTYSTMIGRTPAFATTYHHWGTSAGSEWPQPQIDAWNHRGITPVLSWEPWNNYTGSSDPAFDLDSTLAGQHDVVLDRWITGAKAYGQPIYIRLAHEMNGDWYPWGFKNGHNTNTPAKFLAFWRYVVDRFRAQGATNVRWVWSPNVVDNDKPLTGSYPGDDYVDLVGMDGYNWGTSQSWSSWQTFTTIFGTTYDLVAALSSKPIIVSETASTESGGTKSTWITNAYGAEQSRFPRLAGILWFNQNKETDWRVESTSQALNAYKAAVAQPVWQGRLP
jgi:hypothetical protein